MARRSLLLTRDAEKIAAKLDAEIKQGREHTRAIIRINGHLVGQFGIRRGKNLGHDYVPRQLNITMRQALDIARCNLYRKDYEAILRERGVIPPA